MEVPTTISISNNFCVSNKQSMRVRFSQMFRATVGTNPFAIQSRPVAIVGCSFWPVGVDFLAYGIGRTIIVWIDARYGLMQFDGAVLCLPAAF